MKTKMSKEALAAAIIIGAPFWIWLFFINWKIAVCLNFIIWSVKIIIGERT